MTIRIWNLSFCGYWRMKDGGYKVRLTANGKDGYFAYLLCTPDVVLTDIQMPEKNGFELIESIRSFNPVVRTIYMT